MNKIIKQIR